MKFLQTLRSSLLISIITMMMVFPVVDIANAHGVTGGDKGYIQEITGTKIIPFIYLGAKHMVTGYDHILFLVGIIFFLFKRKDIIIYVSLF